MLHGYHLFASGYYAEALAKFGAHQPDAMAVLGLYPNLLPRAMRRDFRYPMEPPDLGNALEPALNALKGFLTALRAPGPAPEVDFALCTDAACVIDTSLLKAHVKTNDPALLPLLRAPNACHVDESRRVLLEYNKHFECVVMLKHKGMHRDALQILAKQGATKNSRLAGIAETVAYLRELGGDHLDLVLEFSKWALAEAIAQNHAEHALPIFTQRAQPLPTNDVLAHIEKHSALLVEPYLEHVIATGSTEPALHNRLALRYLDTIVQLRRANAPLGVAPAMPNAPSASAGAGARVAAGKEPGLLGETRAKMLKFLSHSRHYKATEIISKFPLDDLYEEKAIVLSRIPNHSRALEIYVWKLEDQQKAYDYCERHCGPKDPKTTNDPDVFLELFRTYLTPPEHSLSAPMLKAAIALLNREFYRIDTPKALELIPPSTPISELRPFFEAALRNNTQVQRDNKIRRNLLRSQNLQVREQAIYERSRTVRIDSDTTCPVCVKRIQTSVFALDPNGTVVHFMCLKKYEQNRDLGAQ